jgi:hypothetical protein
LLLPTLKLGGRVVVSPAPEALTQGDNDRINSN